MRNPFAPLIAIPRPSIPCTIAGSRIGLKLRRLHRGARIIESPRPSGRRIFAKKPSGCVSRYRATAATH
jgi:hypothetical protein